MKCNCNNKFIYFILTIFLIILLFFFPACSKIDIHPKENNPLIGKSWNVISVTQVQSCVWTFERTRVTEYDLIHDSVGKGSCKWTVIKGVSFIEMDTPLLPEKTTYRIEYHEDYVIFWPENLPKGYLTLTELN
jgi:hypothetical protein